MNTELKVLFLGDIVGRAGREAVKSFINNNQGVHPNEGAGPTYDFVIANVENASHGFGLTKKNHDEFLELGIHCQTSGNHIWDKKEVFEYINNSPALIRPLNYPKNVPGVGYKEFLDGKFIVLNLLGRTFMTPVDCPFVALENFINAHGGTPWVQDRIIIIDFHAEATAEKACMARFAAGLGIKGAVLGTHTHVQTADEMIIDGNLAYITDVGFCGSTEGVIGMDYDVSIYRLLTALPERFDVAKMGASQISAVEILFDLKTCTPKKIERLQIKYEDEKGED